jgi:hypothetical protein
MGTEGLSETSVGMFRIIAVTSLSLLSGHPDNSIVGLQNKHTNMSETLSLHCAETEPCPQKSKTSPYSRPHKCGSLIQIWAFYIFFFFFQVFSTKLSL